MAKMDQRTKRLEIPTDLLDFCTFLEVSEKLAFYLENSGEIYLSKYSDDSFPNEGKFLSYCNYDKNTNSFCLPDNVECALGHSNEYYFATNGHEYSNKLYIYRVKE